MKNSYEIYLKYEQLFCHGKELFGSDLYDQLSGFEIIERKYEKLSKNTMTILEKYIRKNPDQMCRDEIGNVFDPKYSGLCKTYFENKTIKEEFYLKDGVIDGELKGYYVDGTLKDKILYNQGIQTGVRTEYFENGRIKYDISQQGTLFSHDWFYENEIPKKKEYRTFEGNQLHGDYYEWYADGQLAKSGHYNHDVPVGDWIEYYPNGHTRKEYEYINGFIIHNFWNEQGVQKVINGTGIYNYEHLDWAGHLERQEEEYVNGVKHGTTKNYLNGILKLSQEFKHGKQAGWSRSYYNNGALNEESLYQADNLVKSTTYPKFVHPVIQFKILSRLCDEEYKKFIDLDPPDNNPVILNKELLERELRAELAHFDVYGQDYVMNYSYIVYTDLHGNVDNLKFVAADNLWIREDIENTIGELKFEPALKGREPVSGIYFVQVQYFLTEGY